MMTRRDHKGDIYLLFGGEEAFDRWESVPLQERHGAELSGEEPYWWILPDGSLSALFRDNNRSGFLYRAFSTGSGRTWSRPVRTNFPDARSKFFGLQLEDGRFVLVSNANPNKRDPLTIAVGDDGMVFTKMGRLVGGRHVDYPHAIEHDGHLYVAFASAKQTVEILEIRIADLDRIDNLSLTGLSSA
jgi:predicted neuraminidase